MMLELLAAATIGVTFGNSWICALLGFGTTSSENARRVGLFFIGGRVLGLVGIGLAIALLGLALSEVKNQIVIAFAVLSIAFGVIMLFLYKKEGCVFESWHLTKRCPDDKAKGAHSSCEGCNGCASRKAGGGGKGEGDAAAATGKFTAAYGLALGAFRGATPCFKLVVLAPLLVSVSVPVAVLMMVVYALTSTIYPLIGFLSARLFMNVKGGVPVVRVAGAVMLIIIGVYSLVNLLATEGCQFA